MREFGLGGRDESDREQRMAEYLGIDVEAVRGLELFSRAHALLNDRGEDELADLLEARRLLMEAAARLERRAPSEWVTVMSELSRVYQRLADAEPGRAAQHLENAIAVRLRAAESGGRADDYYHLARLYDRRVVGSPEENHTHAVRHARAAIAGYDRTTEPVYWSDAQHVLGDILLSEPDRAAGRDTDEAIRCFDLALEVHFPENDVVPWARTLWRRGVAFDARRNGDRGDNVREALSCFSNALDRLEARDDPLLWASLHHSASVTLGGHEFGDPAENAGLALDHLHRCLEVLTRENHPQRWADIQHALGAAYDELLGGDRRTNLESAVEHFGRASRCTRPIGTPVSGGGASAALASPTLGCRHSTPAATSTVGGRSTI